MASVLHFSLLLIFSGESEGEEVTPDTEMTRGAPSSRVSIGAALPIMAFVLPVIIIMLDHFKILPK
jgi:hypothetical protein